MSDNHSLCLATKTGVLLLHGLTGVPAEMRPVAKHLTALGCNVVCPTLPGHGGDHKKLLATGWKDWIAGAREALMTLTKECDHVIVCGLSLGALLAVLAAVEEPKVSGIILLSTTLKYDGLNTNRYQIFLPLVDIIPLLGTRCYWTEEPPYGLKDVRLQRQITKQVEAAKRGENTDFGLFRTYAGSLRQLCLLVNEVKKKARKVRCPALVIHSLEDTLTTVANAAQICKLMDANEKTLVLLGGCDHVLTLDLRRKDVIDHIAHFVIKTSWENQPKNKVVLVSGQ